jgi:hypothetical protein
MIQIPRFLSRSPLDMLLYHEAAELAHVTHKKRDARKVSNQPEQLMSIARHVLGFTEQSGQEVSGL